MRSLLPAKAGRCYDDFNRSQLSRERSRCKVLDIVWHSPSVCLCVQLPRGTEVHFLSKDSQVKRLKLWVLVSVTIASCSALLTTASRWHLSGAFHLYKCSITISNEESRCHYLMLFQGLLLYQQKEGISSDSF